MTETRRILCFGDSNTWGFIPVPHGAPTTRYPRAQRWPHVMAAALGGAVEVIEEALNGRTTDAPDPLLAQVAGAGADGSAYLPVALASHLPLDLVVIMLGTNDVKPHLARPPARIALGAKRLLDLVRTLDGGVGTIYGNPPALLVCPPQLGPLSPHFADMFAGGHAKAAQLPALYEGVARAAGVDFLDAGLSIATDGVDGVHFSAATQRALGLAVAEKVRARLG
jgi:lysophospholipase L1-like esterase